MPTSGTGITYALVGGTNPTNAAGVTGVFMLGGTVVVDFVVRSMNTNFSFGFTGATYSMSSLTPTAINVFSTNGQLTFINLTGTCTGGPCAGPSPVPVSGQYTGSFTGANAAGIGMVYHATGGPDGEIVGALAFKKQ